MYRATADIMLPTSLIGSLPRPDWFTENLGTRTFLQAMVDSRYREQYTDAVAVYLSDQEVAGLDICTDGDAHYDSEVGGQKMAGVEVAFPLLADELVEFASRVPAKWKIKGLKLRWFMKEALRDLLAPSVLTKTKQGFGLPFGLWLKDDPGLEQLAGDSLSDLKARGVVRASFIDDVRERHRSEHAKYYGVMVWRLMMLEQWFKAHQDTPVQANLDGANVDGVRD